MDILLVTFSIGLIVLSVILKFSMLYAFIVSLVISIIYFCIKGYKLTTLTAMIRRSVVESKIVFSLILLMGLVIASWMASGIVPSIIYYGFDFVNKGNFLLNCFLITLVSAMFMGTALGCFSTIGMALFFLGQGLKIPSPILLGAIISGCFMADKMSPISSLVNLLIGIGKLTYKNFLKHILKTTLPTVIISGIIFYIIGLNYLGHIKTSEFMAYKQVLSQQYNMSLFYFLVPLGMMFLSMLGVKVVTNLSVSIGVSSLLAIFVQKVPLRDYLNMLIWGFKGEEVLDLKDLIKGGGLMSMVKVLLVVFFAIILSNIFVETGVLKNIVGKFFGKKVSYFRLVARTLFFSSVLTIVTCDQTCGILLPFKFLKNKFSYLGMSGSLVRSISDSGVIIAPLMNWNVNAIIIFSITGVSAVSYGPYAVLCYIAPIVSLITAYFEGLNENFRTCN